MTNIKATYEDHMGSDIRVVNCARASFGRRSEMVEDPINGTWDLKAEDKGLIEFLARGCSTRKWDDVVQALTITQDKAKVLKLLSWVKKLPTHWTPFAHCQITLHEEVPLFVARQRFKHQVGFVYSEVSRRYVNDDFNFYLPDHLRKSAENVKQGSLEEAIEEDEEVLYWLKKRDAESLKDYQFLLSKGVCAEQARSRLPQSMMVSYFVTGSLYGFANAYNQRSEEHAQYEIRLLADQWQGIIRPLYPHSWRALVA